jgi:hypothetical protein
MYIVINARCFYRLYLSIIVALQYIRAQVADFCNLREKCFIRRNLDTAHERIMKSVNVVMDARMIHQIDQFADTSAIKEQAEVKTISLA